MVTMDDETTIGFEQFEDWVHSALRQLYDAPALDEHPLGTVLCSNQAAIDRAQALRRTLLAAIQSLRPDPATPAHSPDWRGYRILEMRFIEGLSPDEVMEQLALRKSQFFRDQSRILRRLASLLWVQHGGAVTEPVADEPAGDQDPLGAETERLLCRSVMQPCLLSEILGELKGVIEPLARERGVKVVFHTEEAGCVVRASRVMLRQAILSILNYAVDMCHGGELSARVVGSSEEAGIRMTAMHGSTPAGYPLRTEAQPRLELGKRLLAATNGRLHLSEQGTAGFEIMLLWPTSRLPTLLVIDDNQGFLDLFRRYLAGHPWRVIGASSGAQARDVLMPQEDGWELLMALKTGKATRHIPVIVCSVLYESQLALSLGADGFLPKPVHEEALLAALAPWSQSLMPAGRQGA